MHCGKGTENHIHKWRSCKIFISLIDLSPQNKTRLTQDKNIFLFFSCLVSKMITALGQVWHPEHFVCIVCKMELSTTGFFEREGQPYCDKDYHQLFSPRCAYCKGPIMQVRKSFLFTECKILSIMDLNVMLVFPFQSNFILL